MFNNIFYILEHKKKPKREETDDISGSSKLLTTYRTSRAYNLKCPEKTISELIRYRRSRHNQKWYVFKDAKKKPPINVGIYEEFPALEDVLEWLERPTAERSILSNPSVGEMQAQ